MLAVVIAKALEQDELDIELAYDYAETGTELQIQFNLFKERLINDLEPETFADIYAQTIAYGFFCARLHDPTPETFTRGEAAVLIPESNPFLRKFFQDIAGFDLDTRISWLVDDLANLFSATNVGELMEDYGKATQHNDPFLHFYETFLGQYKPELRKSRGVYYTPESVVNFIVRAADEILRIRFDLPRGLADSSKTSIEVEVTVPEGKIKKRKKRNP